MLLHFVAFLHLIDEDNAIMDHAIDKDVFPFMRSAIIAQTTLHKEVSR